MTFILLLLLQFSVFAQKDSTVSKNTPIYSLTDTKTKGVPTIRLRPTRFLVYQSLASSSNAKAQQEFSDATARSRDQVTQSNIIPIGILNADVEISDSKEKKKDFVLMASPIQKDIFCLCWSSFSENEIASRCAVFSTHNSCESNVPNKT